nr:putative RNA-dependent RNA polymerase [Binucleate Rhizoctonia mitovirus 14]
MKRINLLQSLKTAYMNVNKMIPLTANIRDRLFQPLAMNNILSQGRTTNLAFRIRMTKIFFTFILKYAAAHGAKSAVKWLKCSSVALQKELGKDRLNSLLALGGELAYSRMSGGLPRLIPAQQRAMIRNGDKREIRFWLGLFNLYRILKVPGELKISTITAPFTGNFFSLGEYFEVAEQRNYFASLEGFKRIRRMSLTPSTFILSRAASPSSKVSATGILTDVHLLNKYQPALWQEMLYYLYAVQPKVTEFITLLQDSYQLVERIVAWEGKELTGVETGRKFQCPHDMLQRKFGLRAHGMDAEGGEGLSQFALKEEAAGKIRLFALLDSITQSVLAPLHDQLFALLKLIPNDGTFDQEASIRRSQTKAINAGMAFSFDLTAATDRLPAALTASILQTITGKEIGESWLSMMTQRNFWFNSVVAEKLKVPQGPYRYQVGQPMGGLSSWAGLAITHHWIVQLAAHRINDRTLWNTDYEILGDDLVMFDANLAKEYLKIMADLGCEINMNKSINSPTRPVFEFAKRTCWGSDIVSGVSMAQVRAGWRVAGRVANALSFANSGLITSPSLLATALSRYAFSNGKSAPKLLSAKADSVVRVKSFSLGVLSLFGTFYQNGKMSLKELMTALVNPHYSEADYSGEAVGLPLTASLKVAHGIINDSSIAEDREPILWSHMAARTEVFDEYKYELATIMLQSALKKARVLYEKYELYTHLFARELWIGAYDVEDFNRPILHSDLPYEYRELDTQLHNFAERLLGLQDTKEHPEEIYDDLYALANKQAKHMDRLVSFRDAALWLDRVETLEFKLTLPEKVAPGKTILESAPILGALRNMDPNKTVKATYLQEAKFQTVPSMAV